MRLISWNVNGLRACMNKGFVDFFNNVDADIFAIQETKMQESQLDEKIKNLENYYFFNSAIKKGYSGTAIFSKKEPISIKYGIDERMAKDIISYKNKIDYTTIEQNVENELKIIAKSINKNSRKNENYVFDSLVDRNIKSDLNNVKENNEVISENKEKCFDDYKNISLLFTSDEGRLITLEFKEYYFVNCYVPNSKRGLERLLYRAFWEDEICYYLTELNKVKPVIYCGDLNVAHQDIDLKNPKSNHHNAGFTDLERKKMSELLKSGFTDSFRYVYPEKTDEYSWWSYMFHSREKNAGWRIDYFIVSDKIKNKILEAKIHQEILGSDHCPIELDIDLNN